MLLCGIARAQEKSEKGGISGIIYGKNHVFTLTAKRLGLGQYERQRLGLVDGFYPVCSSWQKWIEVRCANVYHKRNVKQESLENIIEGDVATTYSIRLLNIAQFS
jgi:hypothetical protein